MKRSVRVECGFWLLFACFAFFILSPLYLMVKISLSPAAEVMTQHPPLLLRHITWEHWQDVLSSGTLWPPLRKSIVVATFTMLAAIGIAAPAAYVIARLRKEWKYLLVLALFFTRMFPEVSIALPIAVTFIEWNLMDTHLGLVMAHLIKTLPFVAWILIGTFEGIPTVLEESAMVDGCHRFGILWRIVFPLALPGVAVASLFAWLESWNEFTYALYLSLLENTLPLQTYYYIQRGSWFNSASYATMLTIPVILITFFLQRYLRAGYLTGAVKE
ncbi:MAG: carbohydrate ABC transporter permease [Nitrospinota bacterium]|nr:MAG: carbohydrate ABC transporter permease [Nitrospinota bacterium]